MNSHMPYKYYLFLFLKLRQVFRSKRGPLQHIYEQLNHKVGVARHEVGRDRDRFQPGSRR